jgi:hypothetical protein
MLRFPSENEPRHLGVSIGLLSVLLMMVGVWEGILPGAGSATTVIGTKKGAFLLEAGSLNIGERLACSFLWKAKQPTERAFPS